VASSADGAKLVAGVQYGPIYTSTNSGATWTLASAPGGADWASVASSADGTRLAAVDTDNTIYVSPDSGATWTSTGAPKENWYCAASSADGVKLVAAAIPGLLYTRQSVPAPLLNLMSSDNGLVLSWVVPSLSFRLQQNSDLTTSNWIDVTGAPTLDTTNLQYQVIIPQNNDQGFYRLKNP
jgi:hypothetical protein